MKPKCQTNARQSHNKIQVAISSIQRDPTGLSPIEDLAEHSLKAPVGHPVRVDV